MPLYLPKRTRLAKAARGWPSSPRVKPQIPLKIDWSNHITRNLIQAINPNDGVIRDYFNNEIITKEAGVDLIADYAKINTDDINARALNAEITDQVTVFTIANRLGISSYGMFCSSNFTGFELREFSGTEKLDFVIYNGAYKSALSASAMPRDEVAAYAGTYDGANVKCYQNGVEMASTAATGNISSVSATATWWGARNDSYHTNSRIYIGLVFNRALSAAEIKSLSDNPYQIFKPANSTPFLVGLPAAGGGISQAISPATETDAAQAIGKQKRKTISPALETDAAVAITLQTAIEQAITHAAETDEAQSITWRKEKSISPALETDESQSLTAQKTKAISQALETNAAQALSRQKQQAISPALETDTAISITQPGEVAQAIGTILESDQAQSITWRKEKALSPATETDEARPISYGNQKALNPALETDEAQAITWRKERAISPATESDEAQSISNAAALSVSPALETDEAQAITWRKEKALSPATETDTVVSISLFSETSLTQGDIDAIADAVYAKLETEGLVDRCLNVWEAHFRRRYNDQAAQTITIYEADGTTPKHVFDTDADLTDITPQ